MHETIYVDNNVPICELVGHYFEQFSDMDLRAMSDHQDGMDLIALGGTEPVVSEYNLWPVNGRGLYRLVREAVLGLPIIFVATNPVPRDLFALQENDRNLQMVNKIATDGKFLPSLRQVVQSAYTSRFST